MGTNAVGAEVANDGDMQAHALLDLGAANMHTLSLCGIPVEHLVFVPGMTWDEVAPGRRCSHCQDDVAARPAAP